MAPSFILALDHAETYYDTVGGRIHVKWERVGESIEIHTKKADDVHGAVELPQGYRFAHMTGEDDGSIYDRRIYELQSAVYTVCKKK